MLRHVYTLLKDQSVCWNCSPSSCIDAYLTQLVYLSHSLCAVSAVILVDHGCRRKKRKTELSAHLSGASSHTPVSPWMLPRNSPRDSLVTPYLSPVKRSHNLLIDVYTLSARLLRNLNSKKKNFQSSKSLKTNFILFHRLMSSRRAHLIW